MRNQKDKRKYPYSDITEKIIGCAIEVHKTLGLGFKESVCENALICELEKQGMKYERQKPIDISYKGTRIGKHRIDLVVENVVIVELKSVKNCAVEDRKRLLSYLKVMNKKIGLLINFAKPVVEIKRFIL